MIVAALLLAGFGRVAYRLYDLQVVNHEKLSRVVEEMHIRRVPLRAMRGTILDCNENVLAHSVPVRTIALDPREIRNEEARRAKARRPSGLSELASILAGQLEMPLAEVGQRIQDPGRYVVLKHKVSQEVSRRLERMLAEKRLKGVVFEDDQMRVYPNGSLMSHVLGYVNAEGRGVDGAECLMQAELRGQDGWRKIERDNRGREIVIFRNEDFAARNGYRVVLTLDQAIQNIAEQELDRAVLQHRPDSAVAIVMRPSTGEVLAMTNRPTFDPNAANKEIDYLRNRAVSDLIEPGSTFKIVAVAAALNERIVTLDTKIFCENGRWLYQGRWLTDHEPYGWLTVEEVLIHSSNIGAAKIALLLDKERMHRAMREFGFGEKSFDCERVSGWPGEVRGIVHPLRNWSGVSITRIAMGHEVGVTPIQMINAMCALANGGNLMRPQIIKRVTDENDRVIREFYPFVRRKVIDLKAGEEMKEALRQVVSKAGTAERAAIPGFIAAGKTGTAQKVVNGEYANDQFVASFCGFFPLDEPELCIYVMLDNPKGKEYYGGAIAAPVFREIAIRSASYLNLKPTNPLPTTVANRESPRPGPAAAVKEGGTL
jgi:cell division protein FtsI/penicillin-binding protein 2